MKNNQQVDIPLLFFSFAFFIVLIGLFSRFTPHKNTVVSQSNAISITPTMRKNNTKQLKKLDYNLPIVCNYKTKDSSISASINTNSISLFLIADKKSQRYIVEGDCLYSWNINELKGKKECGVGSYINIGRQLLSSGVGSIDSITSMLKKSQWASIVNISELLESCKNVKEIDKEIFALPKKIIFEQSK